ncbi:glycine cleavage system protein GcvH [Pararhodospirillum photometricum]|uniref:Glycine cleavage system H protein n=1 Tax=Pararhodospirillum photometricum DSM 122 TaxID=1150469 RepID=H6SM28_PARPM|nr:glycine cleavage system protein GcvH [Pararhodospirillum photometricum]CCG09043.1 Glycine cleavage system H protein [Pararhodospirillum photometricum DSM 122]
MSTLYFTEDHEWIRVDADGEGTVGVTDHAQQQLGDIVFVELPAVGATLARNGEAAVVESVKAASEVYAPVSGVVTAVNVDLPEAPGTVNEDPMGEGWFFRVKLTDLSELDDLMDQDAYDAFVASQD